LQQIMSEFKEDIDNIIQNVLSLQVIYPWGEIINWYLIFLFLNITYLQVLHWRKCESW
jgi:hypothetical protein